MSYDDKQQVTVYYKNTTKKSWKHIDTNEEHEVGRIKDDWKCHMCYTSDVYFKIISDVHFKLMCKGCARMDFTSFLFGQSTVDKVNNHLK